MMVIFRPCPLPDQRFRLVETFVTVHGDCPHVRGGVRENGIVPLGTHVA